MSHPSSSLSRTPATARGATWPSTPIPYRLPSTDSLHAPSTRTTIPRPKSYLHKRALALHPYRPQISRQVHVSPVTASRPRELGHQSPGGLERHHALPKRKVQWFSFGMLSRARDWGTPLAWPPIANVDGRRDMDHGAQTYARDQHLGTTAHLRTQYARYQTLSHSHQ